MKIKKPFLLIGSILLCQLAGIIGSVATTPAITTWYVYLNKPSFNPPNWIFGPVWVTLYTLMGVSLYLVWVKGLKNKTNAFAFKFFLLHLVFNSLWSIIFFGVKDVSFAFFVIAILWLMIIFLINLFWKIEKKASYLLLPYLAWVSFASILNFFIWQLN